MNNFLKWFFAFITMILQGFGEILFGIGRGFKAIFDIPGFITLFRSYSGSFSVGEWIVAILACILVLAVYVLLGFMIVLLIRKYIRFRHSIVSNEDLLEDSIRLAGTLADEACGWDIPVSVSTNSPDVLTGKARRTDFGASAEHSAGLLGLLARLDLTKEQGVFADLLDEELSETEENRQGLCYVIISTSVREHTTSAIKRFASEVSSLTWLSPVSPDMPEPDLDPETLSRLQYIRMVRR